MPDDTKECPLEMWVKGLLLEDAEMNTEVESETVTGRRERGTLIELNPNYTHDFGTFVPELIQIDKQVREIVFGGEE